MTTTSLEKVSSFSSLREKNGKVLVKMTGVASHEVGFEVGSERRVNGYGDFEETKK